MSPADAWRPRDRLALSVERIGRERQPVLIVDGAVRDAHALVDFAATSPDFAPAYGPAGGYPGLRAPAPLDYVGAMVRALMPAIARAFDLGAVKPARAECTLSLVTLPPDGLVASQRAPHVDTANPMQFALLHYLCDAHLGGTGFFRHRATGYEAIKPDRLAAYEAARADEAPGRGYAIADNEAFERTAAIEAGFDRLIVYRSNLLHSGLISAPELLSADPRRGRLTANIFLTLTGA